jgi:predicted aspartyl protease
MGKKKNHIIKLKLMRIDKSGCHLGVTGKINGKSAFFVIDTGASQTVFDRDRMKNFLEHEQFDQVSSLSTGLGTASMESHTVKVPGLKIGKFPLKDESMILLDLSHVNSTYEMMTRKTIDGVIGGDIFRKYKAIIDYGKKQLILKTN